MSNPGKRAFSVVSPSFSAIAFAGLPKCPACILFLLSPLGLRFDAACPLLTFAAILLLAIPVIFLSMPSCRKCSNRPLYLAIAGSAIMALGRFGAVGSALPLAGAILIFIAVLWGKQSSTARRHC